MTRLAVVALIAFAATGAAGAAACDQPAAEAPAATPRDLVELDDTAQRNAGIVAAPVKTMRLADTTEAPGLIALDEGRTARIGSNVEGILLDTHADVGDRVKACELLAAMHSTVVHEAWAGYRKAVAERRRLEKELAFATAAHERAVRLLADKALSLQEVQRAEADRVAAEQGLDVGRTEVRRAEEELEHLGITNAEDPTGESGEQIPVKTPTAGVVLERLVTPGTAVTPGTPLYVVSDLSSLWALIEIDESLLSHVHVGQSIDVRVAAYPKDTFAGVVALIGDIVNTKTRRVTVRCTLKNADGRLKPQMYATAIIRESEPRDVVVVPEDAIQTVDGRTVVFVTDGATRFRPRPVEVGATVNGWIEVRAGLRAGEQVASAGSYVLKSELLKAAAPEE